MIEDELLYQLALTQIPQIGDVHARALIRTIGSASAVFRSKKHLLEKVEGIGSVRAAQVLSFKDFSSLEKEVAFIQKFKIQPLFITDASYPKRMLHCVDAPVLLFYKGTADLNADKMIGVVGTRLPSEYGKHFTDELVAHFADTGAVIVSGLALGIDSVAHRSAIKHHLPTIGVVGHGLDKIYPHTNTALAKEMIAEGGGILTEFFSGTKPDRHNFPLRNRIVAALCDCVIVTETAIDGGSLITAKLANSYNRDVFALPGRVTDLRSGGCNYLIQHNEAIMITSPKDVVKAMGWMEEERKGVAQRQLFPSLSGDEETLFNILSNEPLHIDEINLRASMPTSKTAAVLLSLEIQGLIAALPGKRYARV